MFLLLLPKLVSARCQEALSTVGVPNAQVDDSLGLLALLAEDHLVLGRHRLLLGQGAVHRALCQTAHGDAEMEEALQ